MFLLLGRKGQSLVELSLMAPLIMVGLYIPADFGIAFFTAQLAQNAAREGVRIASHFPQCSMGLSPCLTNLSNQTCPSTDAVVQEVCSRLPVRLQNPSVSVNLSAGPPCMRSVNVQVTGRYDYFFYQLLRIMGFAAPNYVTMSRATTMRYELQPIAPPCS
jgi:Flp pilus assembly protein TadG